MAAVRAQIDKMGANGSGEMLPRTEGGVSALFPKHHLIVVRFRQYPVARMLPDGLEASNLFAVDRGGRIERIGDAKALEGFFRADAAPVSGGDGAKAVLAVWLALVQEFHQDGMLKFEVLGKEFALEDGWSKVRGRAMVAQGGNGELKAALTFDKEGRLAGATTEATIRQGPRPICQATLLLDANPRVRRIAEQDLLVMGLSARAYVMEQRELAGPELREAIDRVWGQIEANGW